MSEEEIIQTVENAIEADKTMRIITKYDTKPLFRDVLQGLLDLYNQKKIDFMKLQAFYKNDWIRKDKIKAKIKELDTSNDLERYARLILKEILEG